MKRMFLSISTITLTTAVILLGCSTDTTPTNVAGQKRSWDISSATVLGITTGPVTAIQARAIAEKAVDGTAVSVEQQDEDGTQVFGVLVQVGAEARDVKVRVSDGAVLKIESDTDGSGESETGDDD